jgi:hypothetical protein
MICSGGFARAWDLGSQLSATVWPGECFNLWARATLKNYEQPSDHSAWARVGVFGLGPGAGRLAHSVLALVAQRCLAH